jgi:integrase
VRRRRLQWDLDAAVDVTHHRALIATLYRGGLRISEALALRPSDVDADSGELHIRKAKGRKSRRVKLDADALDTVNLWRERRKALGFAGRAPLFCGIKGAGAGGELKTAYIRRLLPQARRVRRDRQAGTRARTAPLAGGRACRRRRPGQRHPRRTRPHVALDHEHLLGARPSDAGLRRDGIGLAAAHPCCLTPETQRPAGLECRAGLKF